MSLLLVGTVFLTAIKILKISAICGITVFFFELAVSKTLKSQQIAGKDAASDTADVKESTKSHDQDFHLLSFIQRLVGDLNYYLSNKV